MPYSDTSTRTWVFNHLIGKEVRSFVDLGAGAGTAKEFYGPWFPKASWTAIEAWEPYVDRFALSSRYDHLLVGDARKIDLPEADVYLVGDVLEHMSKEDALALWDRVRAVSRIQILSLPIIHYPQGAEYGNPYEEHKHHWTPVEVLSALSGKCKAYTLDTVVGSFLYGEI